MPKLKIEDLLYTRLKEASSKAGYSSVEEFVHHVLEKAVDETPEAGFDADVMKRLKGLGYIS